VGCSFCISKPAHPPLSEYPLDRSAMVETVESVETEGRGREVKTLDSRLRGNDAL